MARNEITCPFPPQNQPLLSQKTLVRRRSTCTHGGFAQGALVGGGGIVVCAAAAAAAAESPPFAVRGGVPLLAGVGLEPDGRGNRVGCGPALVAAAACLLPAHGATVPDSAPAGGVPLVAGGASVLSDGSIIVVDPLAQGAAVPTAGPGTVGAALLVVLVSAPGPDT